MKTTKKNARLQCPECSSRRLVKYGLKWKARNRIQQYRCNQCGRITSKPKGG